MSTRTTQNQNPERISQWVGNGERPAYRRVEYVQTSDWYMCTLLQILELRENLPGNSSENTVGNNDHLPIALGRVMHGIVRIDRVSLVQLDTTVP